MLRRPALAVLAATLLALSACELVTGPRGGAPDPITELPRALTLDERALIGAGNRFGFDLIRQLPVQDPDTPNVFLSPLSASMALGMTMNGAEGETWTQMRDALGFDGLDEPAINRAYHDLIGLLRGLDPKVEFGLANSVWARAGETFHEDFLGRVRTWFDAHVETLDFSTAAARERAREIMNDWVAERTNDRIRDLIDEVDEDAIMYLINAVYFNGDWAYQFDQAETRPRPFTRDDGRQVQVDMMSMEADLRYFMDQEAAVIELPYGGRAFTAIAALPNDGSSIGDLMASLDVDRWAAWMDRIAAAEPKEAAVILPKFEIEYDRLLNDDLKALGMRYAFNEGGPADFSRMTPVGFPGEVFISRVQQNSFLKVDEEGTEAAAATYVEMVRTISLPSGPPAFIFDRPFLFVIREQLTGTVLFIGVIGDPS